MADLRRGPEEGARIVEVHIWFDKACLDHIRSASNQKANIHFNVDVVVENSSDQLRIEGVIPVSQSAASAGEVTL